MPRIKPPPAKAAPETPEIEDFVPPVGAIEIDLPDEPGETQIEIAPGGAAPAGAISIWVSPGSSGRSISIAPTGGTKSSISGVSGAALAGGGLILGMRYILLTSENHHW